VLLISQTVVSVSWCYKYLRQLFQSTSAINISDSWSASAINISRQLFQSASAINISDSCFSQRAINISDSCFSQRAINISDSCFSQLVL
jgi:hypothetical protein